MFKAAAETVRTIAADVKHLGAETGMIAVLHTWGQSLFHHPHVHCIVPGIINTVIDLFKDTTLITIIGLFDLLGAVEQALKDPAWLGFATKGYVFSAAMFFTCCFALSIYGRNMERRLAKAD